MHLLELHLQAFGPFTDCRLDLSSGGSAQGLHILHGPNEAGKSSALRALHGLLFGIPARTRDDFIHGPRDLRIGARLQARDGRELSCYRRKGNKNTLLDPDQSPIPEQELSALLGGVDAATFERLFGIDHQTLVSGGEELLAEHGAAADALFGAGIGQLNLRGIAASLTSSADELYRPQASKPLLNQELARYRDLERELKTAGLSARDWEDADRELTAAEQALAAIAQDILAAETRRSLLERVRRTQPNLSRLDELNAELETIGEVPALPEDFTSRRQEAERQLQQATAQRASADIRLAHLRQQADGLVVAGALLAEADTIEALSEELGSYRKAANDRPGLLARRDALRKQATQALAVTRPELPLEQAETLRPLLALRRGAAQLSAEGTKVRAAVTHVHKAQRELQHQLEQREAKLDACPAPPPSAALEDAVKAARRAGDLDQSIAELSDELAHHTNEAKRVLASAGLWSGDLDSLCRAALPNETRIAEFVERESSLHQTAERLAADLTAIRAERTRLNERLRTLQLAGQIPTEDQLNAARAQRERLWQGIKAQCFGSASDIAPISAPIPEPAPAPAPQATETPAAPLPERFEASQSESDSIADRLRREAASVHEQAAIQAKLEQTQAQATELEHKIGENASQSSALAQEWHALWAALGIHPHQPSAMRDWHAQVRPLIEQAGQRAHLAQRLQRLEQDRARLSLGLTRAIAQPLAPTQAVEPLANQSAGQSSDQSITPNQAAAAPATQQRLAPLLRSAERELERMQEQTQEHASLQASFQDLRARRQGADTEAATAERDLADWQTGWQALLAQLGLPAQRDGEAVAEEFERLDQLFALLDREAELDTRIESIDADARAFEQHARDLLARLAPDLQNSGLEPALGELRQRLGRERETRTRRDEINSQLRQAEEELARIDATQAGARAMLSELRRIADCPAPEALAGVEARVARQRDLHSERDALQETLRQSGDGRALPELRAEAASLERDALSAELDALEQQLAADLRPRERAAIERKLHARQALAAMDGSAHAAELAAQLAQTRARIRRLAEQWLQRRFATRLLQDARDRFAERHRDPLLPLIAGYFSQLTEGAFSAVEIDFDQGEQPVLVARRRSGERLGVEALSTGTRDQLYLALRLATLEQRAAHAEPLPLIVDDILVQFDDQRSRATLAALASFSAQTQVILFTHHRYVVEQALALQAAVDSPTHPQASPLRMPIFVHDLC